MHGSIEYVHVYNVVLYVVRKYFRTFNVLPYCTVSISFHMNNKYEGTKVLSYFRKYESTFVPSKVLSYVTVCTTYVQFTFLSCFPDPQVCGCGWVEHDYPGFCRRVRTQHPNW